MKMRRVTICGITCEVSETWARWVTFLANCKGGHDITRREQLCDAVRLWDAHRRDAATINNQGN